MSYRKWLCPVVAASAMLLLPHIAGADEPTAPEPTQIETPLGTVTVAPQPGQSVEDALDAAIQTWGEQNVPRWIRQLSSAEFRERQRAADALYRVGLAAIPALVEATGSEDTEAAFRALAVLTQLWTSRDPAVSDAACDALLKLVDSSSPQIASRIPKTLEHIGKVRLEALGAKVSFFDHDSTYLVQLDGAWVGGNADLEMLRLLPGDLRVWVGHCDLTDAGLEFLGRIEHLRELRIGFLPVSVEALNALAGHPHLQELSLPPQIATDNGLRIVARIPKLQALEFVNAHDFDGDALKHLANHPSLARLNLYGTNTTAANLEHVLSIPRLTSLETPQVAMTDEGMTVVGRLVGLTSLSISNTRVTDAGMANLRHLKSLESLNISENGITDATLEHLRDLSRLSSLVLWQTFVSRNGAETLTKQIPGLQVSHVERLWPEPFPQEALPALQELQSRGAKVHASHGGNASQVFLGATWTGGDDGLQRLAELPHLHRVDINYAATDAAVPHLEKLAELKQLGLRGTQLSESAIERLRAALPMVRVTVHGDEE